MFLAIVESCAAWFPRFCGVLEGRERITTSWPGIAASAMHCNPGPIPSPTSRPNVWRTCVKKSHNKIHSERAKDNHRSLLVDKKTKCISHPTAGCAKLSLAHPRDRVCASLLFGDRTVEQGRKAAREMQRSIDGIVVMLTGRVASKEEDAAGTMGRGSIGSALDPASPDIMRHDQSEGLPIGKNMGASMPPTRFLLCEKPRESIGSPTGRV